MKTNKEFGDYVFEKAERYKAKRAAAIKRIGSGIASCLALAVIITLMGMNGIFNMNEDGGAVPELCMYSGDDGISPRGVLTADPTSETGDKGESENEIFSGDVYFYIKTYNALKKEYTIIRSADEYSKYSAFISNMREGDEAVLDMVTELAEKADFSQCDMVILRILEPSSGNRRALSYDGMDNGEYKFSLRMEAETMDCQVSTDYYIIFVPRENADKITVTSAD